MGRPFTKAGRAGWPYLEVEQFDVRSTTGIQDSRDLLRILKSDDKFKTRLDDGIFVGDGNDNLRKDVEWRAEYVGKTVNFWDLAEADLPWQLSDGSQFSMNGPSEGIRTTRLEQVAQSLTRHPQYKDAYLARNPLRCFHRDDGNLSRSYHHSKTKFNRLSLDNVADRWRRLPQHELATLPTDVTTITAARQFCDCNRADIP